MDSLAAEIDEQKVLGMREKLAAHKPNLMSGPALPSVALDQDNVDDLLADLGF